MEREVQAARRGTPIATVEAPGAIPVNYSPDIDAQIGPEQHARVPLHAEDRANDADELRAKAFPEGDALGREYDPRQKPGKPSAIKRAYALLRYLEHPGFAQVAEDLGFDARRLRIIGNLLTIGPEDADLIAEMALHASENKYGQAADLRFWFRFNSALRAVTDPKLAISRSAKDIADAKTGEVLLLLEDPTATTVYAKMIWHLVPDQPIATMFERLIHQYTGIEGIVPGGPRAPGVERRRGGPLAMGRHSNNVGRLGETLFITQLTGQIGHLDIRVERRADYFYDAQNKRRRRILDVKLVEESTGRDLLIRYEVKTDGGRKTPHQRDADNRLRGQKMNIYDVHVTSAKTIITIDGLPHHIHYAHLHHQLKKLKIGPRRPTP